MTKIALFAAVLGAATACKKKSSEKPAEPPKGSADSGSASGSGLGTGSGAGPAGSGSAAGAEAAPWDGKTRLEIPGFQTPESVLHDGDNDVYYVSNINGKPLEADDNGFISKVSPDGKILELKWIDGAKDNIKLDAPKGLTLNRGELWVADINVVRRFDLKTGEPKGEIKVEGAVFLNDIVHDGNGDGAYVTDSGLDASFKSTGTDAVYHVTADGKAKPLIKGKGLGAPNGVTHGRGGSLWVVTFGSGELYSVDHKGKKQKAEKLPKGQLDGVVELEFGELLVSSWEGKAVYRGNPGGPWKAVVENQPAPADIDWDAKRNRLLIPAFQNNTVVIVPMQ